MPPRPFPIHYSRVWGLGRTCGGGQSPFHGPELSVLPPAVTAAKLPQRFLRLKPQTAIEAVAMRLTTEAIQQAATGDDA
jgi:hypothetical protein